MVSLATTPNIFTLGKGWIYWDALGSWSNPEDFGAQFEDCYIIRPNLVGTSTPVTDVAISNGTHGPNAQMPLDQAVPVMLQADVANVGTVDATDVSVTFNVYTEVSGFALDWTASSAPMMLPVGGSQTVMAPMTYMPMDTGTIIYEYIVSTTGPDGNADNDTTASLIYINETTFARDLAIFGADIGGLGFGSPAIDTAEIGTWYTVNTAADVNSVTGWTFFHGAGEIGATLSAEIYNYTPGVGPGSLVASSNTMMVTDSTVVEYVFTFPGTVNLTPGDYFFAIKGTNFLGQTDEYNAPEVTWGRVGPISGWGDLTGAFPGPMMVWPSMTAVACPTITANTSFSNASGPGMMDGSATVTAGGGQAPYTYLWSNGGTTATIMGLAAGTYTVTVTDANGCTGMGSATVGEDAGSCTPCPQPTNVTRSATSSTITLNWDAEPCAMNSQVQHRIKPLEVINNGGITDQGNGIVGPGITTRTLNYNSANCGLFYQARVRHLCGAGGTNPGPWKLLPVVPTSCSKNGELSVAVELFPNPAEDNVNLTVALTEAVDVNITVYDILGASVYEAEMNGEEGANFFNIDISEMSSGVYTVVLDSNGASNTLKFVKQ